MALAVTDRFVYTIFMTLITHSFQVKRRSLAASTKRALPAGGKVAVGGAVEGVQAGAIRGTNGPTAFAGNPSDNDRPPKQGSLRKKYYARRLQKHIDQAVARALNAGVAPGGTGTTLAAFDSLLQSIVERKVEEALAQRQAARSAAMAAARERGAKWAREQYDSDVNISLDEAAAETGIAGRIINERRNGWSYYALVPQGQKRGFRYPKWQFDADSDRLTSVLAALRDANAGCWTVHGFMIAPNSGLDGLSPRDWILDPTRDLERVLQIARARFTSDQGAG